MRWGRTTTCSYCCSHTGLSASGSVWDRDGVANEQEKRKKPAERLAADARPLATCEGKTRDLNWAAKNRRSELATAYRLFASRLSPTQSQTGPKEAQRAEPAGTHADLAGHPPTRPRTTVIHHPSIHQLSPVHAWLARHVVAIPSQGIP